MRDGDAFKPRKVNAILKERFVAPMKRALSGWPFRTEDGAPIYPEGCYVKQHCECYVDFPNCVRLWWSPCRQIERPPDLHMHPCDYDDCSACLLVRASTGWGTWETDNPHNWPNWSTEITPEGIRR